MCLKLNFEIKMQKFQSVTQLYKGEHTFLSPPHLNSGNEQAFEWMFKIIPHWWHYLELEKLIVQLRCGIITVSYFILTITIPNTKGKDMWKGKQQISFLLTYIISLRLWFGLTPQISWHCELLTRVITIPP